MSNKKIVFFLIFAFLIVGVALATFFVIRGNQEYVVEINPVVIENGVETPVDGAKLTVRLGEGKSIDFLNDKVTIKDGEITVSKKGDVTLNDYLTSLGYIGDAYKEDFIFTGVVLTDETLKVTSIKANGKQLIVSFGENSETKLDSMSVSLKAENTKKVNFSYKVNEDDKTCVITGFLGESASVVNIPSDIYGYKVVGIASGAFMRDSVITSLTIPNTVSYIDSLAFFSCDNLASVEIASNTKNLTIRSSAFQDCKALTDITLPEGVTDVEAYAFVGSGLRSITIKNKDTSVSEHAFADIQTLVEVTASAKVFESIQKEKLKLININGGEAITEGLFSDCQMLESVVIGPTVQTIASGAFRGAGVEKVLNEDGSLNSVINHLTMIKIPECVNVIGDNAFEGVMINELYVVNGSVTVSETAFYGVKTLKKVTAPVCVFEIIDKSLLETVEINGGEAITEGLFKDSNVKGVIIGLSVNSVEKEAFYGCTSLKAINTANVTEIGESAFEGTGLTTLIIPEGVTAIGASAFKNCKSLKEVTLGGKIGTISESTFEGCTALETVEFNEAEITQEDGTVIKAGVSTIGASAFKNTSVTEITIPTTVTEIGESAFEETGLTTLIIPEGVTAIGASAFKNCKALKEVTLGEKIGTISESTFEGCASLTSIDLKNVTDIKESAFKETGLNTVIVDKNSTLSTEAFRDLEIKTIEAPATVILCFDKTHLEKVTVNGGEAITDELLKDAASLSEVVIGETVTTIGSFAFNGCIALTSIDLKNVTKIGESAFEGTGLTTLIIPEGVTAIGASAFKDTKIKELTVDAGSVLTTVGEDAFANAPVIKAAAPEAFFTNLAKATLTTLKTLTDIEINGGTEIAEEGFVGYAALTTITISSTVTEIGKSAFEGSGLTTIIVPESVTAIGASAFKNCESLKEVTLGGKTGTIGEAAFAGCTALTSIDLKNVTEIGESAFEGTGLTTLKVPESVKAIADKAFAGIMITELYIGNSSNVSETAFKDVNTLEKITAPVSVFGNIKNTGSLANVKEAKIIGEGEIPENLFVDSQNLTKVEIGVSINRIGNNAFSGCSNLKEVILNEAEITQEDGTVIKAEVSTIGASAFKNTSVTEITIPTTVTEIGESAFEGTGLTTLRIPESVTAIGASAFKDTQIKELTVDAESALTTVGEDAFANAPIIKAAAPEAFFTNLAKATLTTLETLTDIEINGGTEIAEKGFVGYAALTTITIPTTVTEIGKSAFEGCTALKTVEFNEAEITQEDDTVIKAGVSTIGASAFKNTSVTEITIPTTVKEIGESAFEGTGLTTLIIPEGVTAMGASAFKNCESLKEVTLGGKIGTISESAFAGCKALTTIDLKNVTEIGESAFEGSGLTTVNFGAALSEISSKAFAGTAITSLVISENLTSIEADAFDGTPISKVTVASSSTLKTDAFKETEITEIEAPVAVIPCFDKTSITKVTINGGEAITEGLLEGAIALETVTIGNSITKIGANAFKDCTALVMAEGGNNVTEIGDYAFYNCKAMAEINITESVKTIGAYAFADGISNVTSITIPTSVATIGEGAFANTNITNITVNDESSLSFVDSTAFSGVSVTVVKAPVVLIKALTKSTAKTTLTEVTVNGGTEIEAEMFSGCISLTKVTLGCDVSKIGQSAFSGCTKLTSIILKSENITIETQAFKDCQTEITIYKTDSNMIIAPDAFIGCSSIIIAEYNPDGDEAL